MSFASLQCLPRVRANKAVTADGLGGGRGFEEEGELRLGAATENISDQVSLLQRSSTYFALIFKYIAEGVRNSDDTEAHNGTRFGG